MAGLPRPPQSVIDKTAERIRALRNERGMTQDEFAAHIGFSVTTIRMWEGGRNYPSRNPVARIAAACHVTPEYVRGETDDPQPSESSSEAFLPPVTLALVDPAGFVSAQLASRAAGVPVSVIRSLARYGTIPAVAATDGIRVDLVRTLEICRPALHSFVVQPSITARRPEPDTLLAPSFQALVRGNGGKPSTQTLLAREIPPPDPVRTALGLNWGEKASYRQTLESIDGGPARLVHTWAPVSAPPAPDDAGHARTAVYERVFVLSADAEQVRLLQIAAEAPLLVCERHVYLRGRVQYVATIVCPATSTTYWARYEVGQPSDPRPAWPWTVQSQPLPLYCPISDADTNAR